MRRAHKLLSCTAIKLPALFFAGFHQYHRRPPIFPVSGVAKHDTVRLTGVFTPQENHSLQTPPTLLQNGSTTLSSTYSRRYTSPLQHVQQVLHVAAAARTAGATRRRRSTYGRCYTSPLQHVQQALHEAGEAVGAGAERRAAAGPVVDHDFSAVQRHHGGAWNTPGGVRHAEMAV